MEQVVGRLEPQPQSTFAGRLDQVVEGKRELFLDFIRVYLGLGLVAKGVHFLFDQDFVGQFLMSDIRLDLGSAFISHYIPLAHLGGGLLLAMGLMTRFAALVQLPVLLGAVYFVHLREGLFSRGQTLEFTLLVLFLLVVYAVCGSGRLSVDHYFRTKQEQT
jgi:putative oxidoreductase